MIQTGISDSFNRSWDITKQTFSVISKDKEILAFPVLAAIFSVIFFLLMAVPLLMTNILAQLGLDKLGSVAYYCVAFLLYLGLAFISTFFNVAVVYSAKKRFSGGNPTFSEGLGEAFKRIHLILLWSIVSATVGLILRMLENAAENSKNDAGKIIGQIIAGILGAAWSIASIFVVPAMVFKNIGPFQAIKNSVSAVKKTWGESLVMYYGIGAAQMIVTIAGAIALLVPAVLLFIYVSVAAGIVVGGLFALYLIVVTLLFNTANTIFNTALYMYAEEGKVPNAYSNEQVERAFSRTK